MLDASKCLLIARFTRIYPLFREVEANPARTTAWRFTVRRSSSISVIGIEEASGLIPSMGRRMALVTTMVLIFLSTSALERYRGERIRRWG